MRGFGKADAVAPRRVAILLLICCRSSKRLRSASMNGCRPPRQLGARPLPLQGGGRRFPAPPLPQLGSLEASGLPLPARAAIISAGPVLAP
jgi:hypothetical protein